MKELLVGTLVETGVALGIVYFLQEGSADQVASICGVLTLGRTTESLTHEPYLRRRELLEQAVVPGGLLGTSMSIPKEGKAVLKAAKGLGLAGVIAKKLESSQSTS